MFTLFVTIHIIISILLIIVVLLQSSKGEGLAGAFGGSGITGAVFGGRGAATFLSKTTTILAIAFFLSCLGLTFISPSSGRRFEESAIQKEAAKQGQLPVTPTPNVPSPEQQGQQSENVTLPPVPKDTTKR